MKSLKVEFLNQKMHLNINYGWLNFIYKELLG